MRIKLFAGAAIAALLSAGAASAEPTGWYGAVDAGFNMFGDEPRALSNTGAVFDMGVENGWAGFARIGYRFDENWRVELEGGHRSGDLISADRADYASPVPPTAICAPSYTGITPCGGPEGDLSATTLMVNVLYDFGPGYFGARPFVGLGAGVNRVSTRFDGRIGGAPGVVISADDSSAQSATSVCAMASGTAAREAAKPISFGQPSVATAVGHCVTRER